METCMQEADRLIHGDRKDQYGKAERAFDALAWVWTGLLSQKLQPGIVLSASDVALLMAGLKITRQMTGERKRDNVVDGIGYLALDAEINGYDAP